MNILMDAKKLAEQCVANAMASKKRSRNSCAKKTISMCNGYIIERVSPSGLFRVKNESVGKTVLVSSRKKAKHIAICNCKSE